MKYIIKKNLWRVCTHIQCKIQKVKDENCPSMEDFKKWVLVGNKSLWYLEFVGYILKSELKNISNKLKKKQLSL